MTAYRDSRVRFPFLANASKYAVSHMVVIFGVFHTSDLSSRSPVGKGLFLACMAASSVYSFVWDVAQDWRLGVLFSHLSRALRCLSFPLFPSLSLSFPLFPSLSLSLFSRSFVLSFSFFLSFVLSFTSFLTFRFIQL
jgi:hypothetical protein